MKYLTINWDDFMQYEDILREFANLDEIIISIDESNWTWTGQKLEDILKDCSGTNITETPPDMLLEECADLISNFTDDLK